MVSKGSYSLSSFSELELIEDSFDNNTSGEDTFAAMSLKSLETTILEIDKTIVKFLEEIEVLKEDICEKGVDKEVAKAKNNVVVCFLANTILENISAKEFKTLCGDVKETQIYLTIAQVAYHSTSHKLACLHGN